MRMGVLDVGSNTAHFLVVDAHPGAAPVPAFSHKAHLSLSERTDSRGRIAAEGISELVEFVTESLTLAEDMGVTQVSAFATSAIREAPNSDALLNKVRKRTGVDVQVLSGPEEARLTFLAVRRWYGWSAGRLLVVDIGGGSLEIASGADEDPDTAFSLPLGAGRLTRRHLPGDPPPPEAVKALRRSVRAEVASVVGRVRRFGDAGRAVATSKTFRQLARIAGAAPSSEGPYVDRRLAREDVRMWTAKLAEMTAAERADLPGVSGSRARQLLAGAVVAEAAMDLFEVDEFRICPWALREGMILRLLDQLQR